MSWQSIVWGVVIVAVAEGAVACEDEPIRLHPENPHYLSFRGQPTILVGSGEHYGAVLNLDFDFGPYLQAISDAGLNQTRTFSGTYREVPGSFKIEKNTLAPAPNRYQSPWKKVADARDGTPERFDLDQFDPTYFERVEAFVRAANEKGVVVELVLFCPLYEPELWEVNPMNTRYNVNNVGDCPRDEVYTLKHPGLLKRQLAFTRELVTRLNDHENLYYEICNEPYFGGVTLEWQKRVAEEIVDAEKDLPKKHLIAQNIANEKQKVDAPAHPEVDILNFHYAEPQAALENMGLGRAIGDDETGFDGTEDRTYRTEAWRFLLSGGSIFSHLDYSFTVDNEDGTAVVREPTPGGGGPTLRRQFAVLKRSIEDLDFVKMKPDPSVIGQLPDGARGVALAESGRQYLIHVDGGGGGEWRLKIPQGEYRLAWIDPLEGRSLGEGMLKVEVEPDSTIPIDAPEHEEDVVLRLVRSDTAGDVRAATPLPRLKVSEDRRFLESAGNEPFFYLGDTAWELFHRLDRDETTRYLDDRAEKGFNVIQAVALAELDGLNTPNANGDRPLIDNDPTRPNEAYFQHVDWVIDQANERRMYVGLLPTWGDKVNKKWGAGSEIFTPENARVYGEFLGKRYKDKGIIWILGGDRPVETDAHRAIWTAMAEGLRAGDGGAHLISYHPMGGQTSADAFPDAPWLDFHMMQSGHGQRDGANYDMITRLYEQQPTKPCLDAEPRYEDHPVDWKPEQNGWFDEYDVRKAAYWSVFAGGCGVTYGCHDIWQFLADGREPVGFARNTWEVGLEQPASAQMQHLKHLMLSRPFLERIPDQSLIVGDVGAEGEHAQATRAADGSYAFVYVPTQRAITIELGKLAPKIVATWYNPRDGSIVPAGSFERSRTTRFEQKFEPPAGGGRDWVLILDDAQSEAGRRALQERE